MPISPLLLVCDDDIDDQLLLQHAFKEAAVQADFRFTSDGKELIDYLQETKGCELTRCPNLIMLDLNMPQMSGLQALEWIRSNPKYRAIPIVIYTTSHDGAEIQLCYFKGANSFMTKCSSVDELVEKVKALARYWLDTVELPKTP